MVKRYQPNWNAGTNSHGVHDAVDGEFVRYSDYAALEAKLAEAVKDTERLGSLREMCGYVEDGSSDVLKICQDDATGDWLVRVGDAWPAHGRTLRQAIDAAIATRRVREGGKEE